MPRVLQGIADAVNELVDTTHMKYGIFTTLEDVEIEGNTTFMPVHLGKSCMRILRTLLQKHVPEMIQDEGFLPRIKLFLGCGGDPVIRFRAQTSMVQETLGALNISSVSLRLRNQEGAVKPPPSTLVIHPDD